MSVYLGEIAIRKNYVNFTPTYLYENDRFLFLSKYDIQALLPDSGIGNIYFYGSNSDVTEHFHEREYFLLDFETKDLEDHTNSSGERYPTGYKINADNLFEEGKLRRINEIGLYRLIEIDNMEKNYSANPISLLNNPILMVNDPNVHEGMSVFLELPGDDCTLIGPFCIEHRAIDDRFIIKTNPKKDNKHLIPAIKFHDRYNKYIEKIGYGSQQYVKINANNCEKKFIDIITKEILLKNFMDTIDSGVLENGRINIANIQEVLNVHDNSLFVDVPDKIKEERLRLLRNILTDEGSLSETFGLIGDAVASLILKYKDSDYFLNILERLVKDSQFMGQVQRFEIINRRIEEKNDELGSLNDQIELLRKQNERDQKIKEGILFSEKKTELDAIQSEIDALKVELNFFGEVAALQERKEGLDKEVCRKERQERELDAKIKALEIKIKDIDEKLEEKLNDIFKKSEEKTLELVFDGMLSSRILQSAAAWNADQIHNNYERVVSELRQVTPEYVTGEPLIDYLCQQIYKYRPTYGKNTVLNLFICVTQGFLTVFSGEPGTGKTSICNIIAHTLGLTMPEKRSARKKGSININRYIAVSVERGWTNKRDFIGYYNPLTKQFDRSNRQMYDSLHIMDIEAKGNATGFPYIMLLDEANLSPMEYYWADFMNICDDLSDKSSLNLGEDFYFQIPDFLRFVATINNDHTTEALSPRLIDRAAVIKLPTAKSGVAKTTNLNFDGVRPIAWRSLVDTFAVKDDGVAIISGTAKEIYEIILTQLKKLRISVSPRIDAAIRRYWYVAQSVFENEDEYAVDASIVALDYAIAQRILPHINGSGETFAEDLKELSKIFSNKNLRLSAEILNEIILKGNGTMLYYQYFA